jgi:hypothetical protein
LPGAREPTSDDKQQMTQQQGSRRQHFDQEDFHTHTPHQPVNAGRSLRIVGGDEVKQLTIPGYFK